MAQIVAEKQRSSSSFKRSRAGSGHQRSPTRTRGSSLAMATPQSALKRQRLVMELLTSDEEDGKINSGLSLDLNSGEGSDDDVFSPGGRQPCKFSLTIDSDDSDHLDIVLEQMRTPKRRPHKTTCTPRDVIEVSSDSEEENMPTLSKPKTPSRSETFQRRSRPRAASCATQESARTPADNQRNVRIPRTEVRRGKRPPEASLPRRSPRMSLAGKTVEEFLESLSNDPQASGPEVQRVRENFARQRDELTRKLLRIYCEEVFCGKLGAEDVSVDWNVRLTCTAGLCHYGGRKKDGARSRCRIELSPKVVDRPERLRDTLLHELCHAATWILHGQPGGHGGLFHFWADCAARRFPAIPSVKRCHNYKIEAAFVYNCQGCGGCVRRHSRSLDVQRKVCGRCGGRFVLLRQGTKKSSVKEA